MPFFHRHCHAWVRVSADEIALMCVHCWDLGNGEDAKVLGEWWEQPGDQDRLEASQAAFKKAHANGCPENPGMFRPGRPKPQRRPVREFDWGA